MSNDGSTSLQKRSKRENVPRWIPISMIALSYAAAMIALIILLRRHRAKTALRSLESTPPPRRGSSINHNGPKILTRASGLATSTRAPTLPPQQRILEAAAEDEFNHALYGAKAFGYATLMVTVGAVSFVWGIRTYFGVQTAEEFATRMRTLLLTKMPLLSSRIHRSPADDETDVLDSHTSPLRNDEPDVWNWPDAEKRLTNAFDKDGFSGWAQAAVQEVEAEHRSEKIRRAQLASGEPAGRSQQEDDSVVT